MITHINAASRLAVIDGVERLFAFAGEFIYHRGVVEVWFDHAGSIGHERAIDGTITPITAFVGEATLRQVLADWWTPGVYRIPWRGGDRVYVIGEDGSSFIGTEAEVEASLGKAVDLPIGTIARIWSPADGLHYTIGDDFALHHEVEKNYPRGREVLDSLEILLGRGQKA